MSHFVYLNTKDRDDGTNADAFFILNRISPRTRYYLTIESIQIPHMAYPFSISRGNYQVTIELSEGGFEVITLPVDTDYNGTTLVDALNAGVDPGLGITFSYDVSSKRITMTRGANSFRIVNGDNSAHIELGYDVFNTSFYTSVIFSSPVDLSGTKYVDVICSLGGGFNYSSSGTSRPIARIPVRESFGEVILFEPRLKHSVLGKENTENIELQLRDDRGKFFDLKFNSYVSYSFMMEPIFQ